MSRIPPHAPPAGPRSPSGRARMAGLVVTALALAGCGSTVTTPAPSGTPSAAGSPSSASRSSGPVTAGPGSPGAGSSPADTTSAPAKTSAPVTTSTPVITSTPVTTPSAGAASVVPPPTASLAITPDAGVTTQTLTGVIGPGVESGCVVLTTDGAVVANLVGLPAAELLARGGDGPVQVQGYPVEGGMSFCQQGRMFQVTEIVPN